MKSIDVSLRWQEKANQGNLCDWMQKQNRETHTSFILVGTG